MLRDEIQPNLGHEAKVVKRAYILVQPVVENKVPFFLRLKISYLKNSSYAFLGELSLRLIDSIELTDSVGENLWDFQLNTEVALQTHENQSSFDQVEILNVSCKNEEKSSLNILLEEVLAANAVNKTAVIDDEMNRVFRS